MFWFNWTDSNKIALILMSFIESSMKYNANLVSWIASYSSLLWEFKVTHSSPGTFTYFCLTVAGWFLWSIVSFLGGCNVMAEAALNLSQGMNVIPILLIANMKMFWLGIKFPALIILSLLDQIPLVHRVFEFSGIVPYLITDLMDALLHPIRITNIATSVHVGELSIPAPDITEEVPTSSSDAGDNV
jgi:hypothetical protein